jgi:DNA repair protein RecO (recombination protein O)
MLHKTRGIVFKTTDYSESSVVVQVLTEKFGMQSYLINGVKKPGAKIRLTILQPLFLLDMVVYHKPSGTLQRAAEIRHAPVFRSLPYNIVKSSLALFLNEVLYRAIRHQSADGPLFSYLFHAIEFLDQAEKSAANFHLVFLMRLTRFLGFEPQLTQDSTLPVFDLLHAEYLAHLPAHTHAIQEPVTSWWRALSACSFEAIGQLRIPASERRYLLSKLLDYYRLHLENFGEIRSLNVLEEVLNY